MPRQMLSEAEWSQNVGTHAFPVSFLHEYAVGLLWDALHTNHSVTVKTMDGSMSDNLMHGVERVVIPDSMQPIGGCIPDLALLDKDLRPVRVIEVVVTSPPTEDKAEKLNLLEQRGVEVVLVPVRNEEELKALVPTPIDGQKITWSYGLRRRIRPGGPDSKIEELIDALIHCLPETRRKLVRMMEELDSLESCYPLSPNNPKRVIPTANGMES